MSKNITTDNGAEVIINEAPFPDAMALKNAVIGQIGSNDFRAEFIDATPAVYVALWPCLIRCTYNGEKITPQTFETSAAREDYYKIVNACVEENLRPFFKGLGSEFNLFRSPKSTNTPPTK